MLPERLRHSPVLVLLPPVLLFIAGMTKAVWSGVALWSAGSLLGALALAVAVLLGSIAGPFALLVFYLTMLGAACLFAQIALEAIFGISSGFAFWLAVALVFAGGYFVAFMRSPFRHTFAGEIIIDLPRSAVWDALYLQPTNRHWKPHVRKVEAVPGRNDHFNQYHRTVPGADDATDPPPTMIKRSDVAEGISFTVESVPSDDYEKIMAGMTDRQTYTLEDAGAGTRVNSVEVLTGARLDLLVMSALIRPVQDELRQLKAILEGAEDKTFASSFYRDDE